MSAGSDGTPTGATGALGRGALGRGTLGKPGTSAMNSIRAWTGPAAALAIVASIAIFNATILPPAVTPDGGWPAAARAGARIETAAAPGPIVLVSLPAFKTAEAYAFPLARDGRASTGVDGRAIAGNVPAPETARTVVVVCDALFVTGCGGPAEAAALAARGPAWAAGSSPVDRFEAAPGRTISVYRR